MSSSLRSMDSIMIFITASLPEKQKGREKSLYIEANIFKSVEKLSINALICYRDKNGIDNEKYSGEIS